MDSSESLDLESKRLLSNQPQPMPELQFISDISTPPPTHQLARLIKKLAAISPGEPSESLSHRTIQRCFKIPHPAPDDKNT